MSHIKPEMTVADELYSIVIELGFDGVMLMLAQLSYSRSFTATSVRTSVQLQNLSRLFKSLAELTEMKNA